MKKDLNKLSFQELKKEIETLDKKKSQVNKLILKDSLLVDDSADKNATVTRNYLEDLKIKIRLMKEAFDEGYKANDSSLTKSEPNRPKHQESRENDDSQSKTNRSKGCGKIIKKPRPLTLSFKPRKLNNVN